MTDLPCSRSVKLPWCIRVMTNMVYLWPRYEWDMTIFFEGVSVTSWERHCFFTSEVLIDGWPQTVNHLHSVQTQCSTTSTAGEDIIHTKAGVFFNWQCISAVTGKKKLLVSQDPSHIIFFIWLYLLYFSTYPPPWPIHSTTKRCLCWCISINIVVKNIFHQ